MTPKPIFVSYSTDDSAVAEQIRDGLEAASISCWMAPRDIVPGKEYAEQILDAIENCEVMVLVLSETSNSSRFVRSEVERAVSKNKVIVPVRIHEVTLSRSLEFFISSAQWIDALEGVATAVPALASALRQHLPVASPIAAKSHRERVRNLPDPGMPFVGRSREIGEILDQLSDQACRLLTLVGQGGIGKTRLAIEAARHAYERGELTPDGVYFVALETLRRPEQIAAAVAGSFGLPVEGADPHQLVQRFVAGKRLLLVMDNFEHLLEGVNVVVELLSASPGVKVLATSRETLNLKEEWFYPVAGLDLPEGSEEQVRRSAAVQLFLQNAQRARVNRDFTAELPCIVRVCRMVEGAPLALELAAHWLRTLSCGQIVEQLQKNLDLLATSVRNVPERHRSMRAAFDYSWQLTGQRGRATLCQLAVFAGGFDWEAFQAVTQGTLGELSLFVESSWIQPSQSERYTLHPLVRSYLVEKLDQEYPAMVGETADEARDRHSRFYAEVANESEMERVGREIDNLAAGWRHAVDRLDVNSLKRYAEPISENREWPLPIAELDAMLLEAVGRLRQRQTGGPDDRLPVSSTQLAELGALLLLCRSSVTWKAGRVLEAERLIAETQFQLDRIAEYQPKSRLRISVLMMLAQQKLNQGRYGGVKLVLEEAERLSGSMTTSRWLLEGIPHMKGMRAEEIGAYDRAAAYHRGVLEHATTNSTTQVTHSRLLAIAVKQGKRDEAYRHLAAIRKDPQALHHHGQFLFAVREADYELLLGNASATKSACTKIIDEARSYGYSTALAMALNLFGRTSAALYELSEAKAAFAEARQVADGRFFQLSVEALVGLGMVGMREGQYQGAEERFRQVLDEAWPVGLLPEALEAVVGLAEIRADQEDVATARQWLQVAIAHPATIYLVKIHAREVLKDLGEESASDEPRDPQAELEGIVTAVVSSAAKDHQE